MVKKTSRSNKVLKKFKIIPVLQSVRIVIGIIVGRPQNVIIIVHGNFLILSTRCISRIAF